MIRLYWNRQTIVFRHLDVIETAIDHIYTELAEEQDTNYPSLELTNDNGEGLDCENGGLSGRH